MSDEAEPMLDKESKKDDQESKKEEEPEAAAAPVDEKPPSEKEAMMEEEPEEELDEMEKKIKAGAFMCCCCLCHCTEEETKKLTCCCFFPIKCGVLFIAAFIIAIILFVFLEIFYELLNDDIHWWYVLVGVILASTLIVASAFSVVFFTKDEHSSRVGLNVACMLVLVGVSLVAIWAAVYFVFLYKKDTVTTGNDGVGFIKATRKQEVVVTLYIACCICALFAYFICVVNQYVDALKTPEEPMEEMMMDEMMMEEEKKDDEMMMEE